MPRLEFEETIESVARYPKTLVGMKQTMKSSEAVALSVYALE